MVAGKKIFYLFHPHNNENLYEGHIREGELIYDIKTKKFIRSKLLDSTSMVMSPVNILKPNYTEYPKFSAARPMTCEVDEGDMLYLPAFWWHEVQSKPPTAPTTITSKCERTREKEEECQPFSISLNIAINFWYNPLYQKEFPCNDCPLYYNYNDYQDILQKFSSSSKKEKGFDFLELENLASSDNCERLAWNDDDRKCAE